MEHTCFVVLNVFRHWREICFFLLCFRNATIHVEMMRDLVNFFFGDFFLRDRLRIVVVFHFCSWLVYPKVFFYYHGVFNKKHKFLRISRIRKLCSCLQLLSVTFDALKNL